MARPKKNDAEPSALERIDSTFWQMLSEMPYDAITISSLARRAGVNHNTIYYYYECIDQMALDLFEKNMPSDASLPLNMMAFSDSSLSRIALNNPCIMDQGKKVYLFLRSGSAFLTQHLKKRFIENWCRAQNVSQDKLTALQKLELEFIFSGMTSTLCMAFDQNNPDQLSELDKRPLGQAIVATLANLTNDAKN